MEGGGRVGGGRRGGREDEAGNKYHRGKLINNVLESNNPSPSSVPGIQSVQAFQALMLDDWTWRRGGFFALAGLTSINKYRRTCSLPGWVL